MVAILKSWLLLGIEAGLLVEVGPIESVRRTERKTSWAAIHRPLGEKNLKKKREVSPVSRKGKLSITAIVIPSEKAPTAATSRNKPYPGTVGSKHGKKRELRHGRESKKAFVGVLSSNLHGSIGGGGDTAAAVDVSGAQPRVW